MSFKSELKKWMTFILFIVLSLGLSSCKEQAEQVNTEANEVVEIPGSFLDFYKKFLADSTFQKERIVFPLSGKSDSTKWLKANWVNHKPLKINPNEFIHDFDNFEGIITERIIEKQGMYSFTRRYAELQDSWHLISYEEKNNLDGFEPDQK